MNEHTTLWSRDQKPLEAGVLTDPDWNKKPAALRLAWAMREIRKAKHPDARAVNQERFIASQWQQLVGGHSGIPAPPGGLPPFHWLARGSHSALGLHGHGAQDLSICGNPVRGSRLGVRRHPRPQVESQDCCQAAGPLPQAAAAGAMGPEWVTRALEIPEEMGYTALLAVPAPGSPAHCVAVPVGGGAVQEAS